MFILYEVNQWSRISTLHTTAIPKLNRMLFFTDLSVEIVQKSLKVSRHTNISTVMFVEFKCVESALLTSPKAISVEFVEFNITGKRSLYQR